MQQSVPKLKTQTIEFINVKSTLKIKDRNLNKSRLIITLPQTQEFHKSNQSKIPQIKPIQTQSFIYEPSSNTLAVFMSFLSLCCRLKYLNLTGNDLQSVPQFSFTHSSRLHELYLSDNRLEDDSIPFLCTFTKLRILHIAHNRITEIKNR